MSLYIINNRNKIFHLVIFFLVMASALYFHYFDILKVTSGYEINCTGHCSAKVYRISENKLLVYYEDTNRTFPFLIHCENKKVYLLNSYGRKWGDFIQWPHRGYRGVDLTDPVKCHEMNAYDFSEEKIHITYFSEEEPIIITIHKKNQQTAMIHHKTKLDEIERADLI